MQRPQPLHIVSSIETVPSAFFVIAGQPGRKQAPHFLHLSETGLQVTVLFCFFKSTQGAFVMITDTSSFATSSFIILSNSAVSKAFTSTTFLIPNALQSPKILIAGTSSPISVFPVAAWS